MLRLDPWDLVSLEARSKKLEAACNVSALFRRFVSAFFAKSSMFMRFVSAFRRLTPFFFMGLLRADWLKSADRTVTP